MASRIVSLELPRRISGYFLLFFAAALLWLMVGAVIVVVSAERKRTEQGWVEHLRRVHAQVHEKDLIRGNANLQALMKQLQANTDLEYCCVVSREGEIWAHSSPAMVGQFYQEPTAVRDHRDEFERLRFRTNSSQRPVCEYRCPLGRGHTGSPCLHIAFFEPTLFDSSSSGSLPLVLLGVGPAAFMVLGTIAIRRSVTPFAAIESQLGRAARSVCPTELEFDAVPSSGLASQGWNRLVAAHHRQRASSGLERRASAALQAATASSGNAAWNSLPDGLALTGKDGRITFANRALAAICARQADELAGKTMDEVLDLKSHRDQAKAILDANSLNRSVNSDLQIVSEGTTRILRVARYPLWDADGRLDGSRHVWSVRDITQQQLVSQTRDQFLQTAAHELRTPLANIKAYAETLSFDDTINTERQKDFCNIINAEATRLARLIEDLLNVSSMEAGALSATPEETDLGRLVAEVVEKVRPLMDQKRLDFRVNLPQKWPKAHLDKDKIAASLVNVLGNAAKYTPADGRVELQIAINDGKLSVLVSDTGIGIDTEELPKISEKFFRSSDPRVRQQPGSGLGLSLVKEVVRLHGGSMDIRSETDKGTSVTITLPIL